MADDCVSVRPTPAKRCRLSISRGDISPLNTSGTSGETVYAGTRLGSMDMFAASDSGFSELTSSGSSEDDQPTSTNGELLCRSDPGPAFLNTSRDEDLEEDQEANEEEEEDDDDDDASSSSSSDVSVISGLSDLGGHDWEPTAGSMTWVQQQMNSGMDPRRILADLVPNAAQIPSHLDDVTLWKIIVNIVSEPPRRKKLDDVNTLDDVVKLLRRCKKILVLTGAGVSVSCGIPDFRSRDGIYARLAVDFPDLPDPQAMFDIHYFRKDPRPFFKFAREIWPGQFTPSRCHRFIRQLERQNKLLRNYTQNIDTLEQQTNISNVINCHGSFATATCLNCKHRVDCKAIEHDIMQQKIPFCPVCVPCPTQEHIDAVLSGNNSTLPPIMKPDIVFFGESMPDEFHNAIARDKEECDLLIVIGSSLKVRPVALIPSALPEHVPQILINREPLRHCVFDVELLGDCDVIVNQLCHILGEGQEEVCYMPPLQEITRLPSSLFTSRKASPIPSSSAMALAASATVPKSRVKAIQGESSRRDSGLSTDSEALDAEENKLEKPEEEDQPADEEAESALKGWWQPRIRANLASSLPENTYFFPHDGRYVFPGAELMYDPDTSICSSDSCHDSDEDFDQELEDSISGRPEIVDLEDLQPSLSSSPSHRFSMESYGIGVVDTDFDASNQFNSPETE